MRLLTFAKVKRNCHAGSNLFVIQHGARLKQDSCGMTWPKIIFHSKKNRPVTRSGRSVKNNIEYRQAQEKFLSASNASVIGGKRSADILSNVTKFLIKP
jgi:hypothetical protein